MVNAGALEWYAIPAPLMAFVVLLLSDKNYRASGPVALCMLRPFSSFLMPLLLTCMLGIVGWGLGPFDGKLSKSSFV
jgi:hypothetical protein